jgi:hypothetical protein
MKQKHRAPQYCHHYPCVHWGRKIYFFFPRVRDIASVDLYHDVVLLALQHWWWYSQCNLETNKHNSLFQKNRRWKLSDNWKSKLNIVCGRIRICMYVYGHTFMTNEQLNSSTHPCHQHYLWCSDPGGLPSRRWGGIKGEYSWWVVQSPLFHEVSIDT